VSRERKSERSTAGFVYRQRAGRASGSPSPSLLYCDEISLELLAERFSTPLYIYSASFIRERMHSFDTAFRSVPHTVCYSVKANSNLAILRLLAKLGCGFDIVSGGELERVLRVSRTAANKTVFSGVGKTRNEMNAALRANILLFNVESESELRLLAECAARTRKTAPIALRVNPDVPTETHPYISTGLHRHKFGIPVASAVQLYDEASRNKHLRIAGVSVHIGSQIKDVQPFTETMRRVAELVHVLRGRGHPINYVDAGGGLGINYEDSVTPKFGEYAAAVSRPLRGLKVHLLLEPGRSVVATAGVLLTRLLYRKTNGGKKFLVVDAAMNDLLRPALYNAHHRIVSVSSSEKPDLETTDVVGPVCESGDFLARDRQLPVTREGDLLAILDAGAYGMALASNYNSRPRAAEVLVDGKSVKLIRKRETIRDLLRNEI
jgi:diaminopimelate decarboxylase